MNRTRSWGLAAAASVIAGLCGSGSPAWAEVGVPVATVQAVAADAQFLEYAPPPAAPGVVCLIDSGVDPNPDTTPILVGSDALQAGTDTADELSKLSPRVQPGNHPDGHGTYMAMIMAAPVNGWGMAGIAPTSVRVYSVKALAAAARTFSFAVYANSIVHCASGPVGVSGIKVVNLSLGSGTQPTSADVDAIESAVIDARHAGLTVVGAAGNDGGDVSYPAAADGVFAVGATDANPAALGVFCATSDRGAALRLLAPGCGSQSEIGDGGDGIDVAFSDDGTSAWSSGTSDSSAIVSAVLASIRAYAPGLTAEQAEDCLTSTAVDGGNLDAAAAFRACGLGTIVTQGLAAYNAAVASPASPAPPATVARPTQPAVPRPAKAPRVMARWTARPRVLTVRDRRGQLVVRVANLPRGARVSVNVEQALPTGAFRMVARSTANSDVAVIKVRNWDRIAVYFVKNGRHSYAAYIMAPSAAGSHRGGTGRVARRPTRK